MKQVVEGSLIEADASRIVMSEGDTIATYSNVYYRLPLEYGEVVSKPRLVFMTDPLPAELEIGPLGHGILVPQ